MLAILSANAGAIINSIGLILNIVGAWLVAIEVVKEYKGQHFKDQSVSWSDIGKAPEKSPEYQRWELSRHRYMVAGLAFLTIGFLFQLVSNWLR